MKPVVIINTFKSIIFDESKKPIIICDIDHTFIRPKLDYKHYYELIRPDFNNTNEVHKMVLYMLEMCISRGLVKQTDKEGFLYIIQKINELGGKLVFLTARHYKSHEKTIQDLKNAGLQNPEQFQIHYTGHEITKGDYINKFNLLDGYDHHIFIDDYPDFLESALRIFPYMDCYLFKYDK